MAKEQKSEPVNQLNLTVVALVALVAIVGLVALVMNAAAIVKAPVATGSEVVSAQADAQNIAGNARASCSIAGFNRAVNYNCGSLSGDSYRDCYSTILHGCTDD